MFGCVLIMRLSCNNFKIWKLVEGNYKLSVFVWFFIVVIVNIWISLFSMRLGIDYFLLVCVSKWWDPCYSSNTFSGMAATFSLKWHCLVGLMHCLRDPQNSLFSNFFIKNWSHGTIHTFKNYFATVLLVLSFQQNKQYPNGLLLDRIIWWMIAWLCTLKEM